MTHPLLANELKKGSKDHTKAVYMVTFIVFGLGAFGGLLLGYRINQNEQAMAKIRKEMKENPEKYKNARRPPVQWR